MTTNFFIKLGEMLVKMRSVWYNVLKEHRHRSFAIRTSQHTAETYRLSCVQRSVSCLGRGDVKRLGSKNCCKACLAEPSGGVYAPDVPIAGLLMGFLRRVRYVAPRRLYAVLLFQSMKGGILCDRLLPL